MLKINFPLLSSSSSSFFLRNLCFLLLGEKNREAPSLVFSGAFQHMAGPAASYFFYHFDLSKGRTQCRELQLCAGSGEGYQWQALPSPMQYEETATRTRDLPVTGGKTLPLAPGPPFKLPLTNEEKKSIHHFTSF